MAGTKGADALIIHRNPGIGSGHDRRNHVVARDLVMTQVTC